MNARPEEKSKEKLRGSLQRERETGRLWTIEQDRQLEEDQLLSLEKFEVREIWKTGVAL